MPLSVSLVNTSFQSDFHQIYGEFLCNGNLYTRQKRDTSSSSSIFDWPINILGLQSFIWSAPQVHIASDLVFEEPELRLISKNEALEEFRVWLKFWLRSFCVSESLFYLFFIQERLFVRNVPLDTIRVCTTRDRTLRDVNIMFLCQNILDFRPRKPVICFNI